MKPAPAPTGAPESGACDVRSVDLPAVRAVRNAQAPERSVADLADIFQMLASPARLRIVEALAARELCVCDLAAVVGVSESAVSHHLRQMRQLRVVRYRKEGRLAFYRLADDHIRDLFRIGLDHASE
ncbi:MAG: metalloregulator ArsR/SmtB family transcription factor [Gemmatimonadota bacterium]